MRGDSPCRMLAPGLGTARLRQPYLGTNGTTVVSSVHPIPQTGQLAPADREPLGSSTPVLHFGQKPTTRPRWPRTQLCPSLVTRNPVALPSDGARRPARTSSSARSPSAPGGISPHQVANP